MDYEPAGRMLAGFFYFWHPESMTLRIRIILYLLVIAAPYLLHGALQSPDKDLRDRLSSMPDDTIKVKKLIQLAEVQNWSDIQLSRQYASEALRISERLDYTWGIAHAKYRLGQVFIDSDIRITEGLMLESLETAVCAAVYRS